MTISGCFSSDTRIQSSIMGHMCLIPHSGDWREEGGDGKTWSFSGPRVCISSTILWISWQVNFLHFRWSRIGCFTAPALCGICPKTQVLRISFLCFELSVRQSDRPGAGTTSPGSIYLCKSWCLWPATWEQIVTEKLQLNYSEGFCLKW